MFSRLLHAFCLLAAASAAKKPKTAQKVDLPGIACDVCTMAVQTLYEEVSTIRKDAPYNKIEELEVQTLMESMCKPDGESGEWIRHVDIVTAEKNDKSYARLEVPGGISKCETECLTVAKSCEDLFEDEIDQDDLSAILFKNKHSLERLSDVVCKKWTKRCSKSSPALPAAGRVDYPFFAMEEKDLEMERMMAEMKKMGMGGMSMYNRDDMDELAEMGGGYGGYDDEDPYGGFGGMPPMGGEEDL